MANSRQGYWVEPTILLNVPSTSQAYTEEIFGPVMIVNTFKNEEEALSEANMTEFGLFCKLPGPPLNLTTTVTYCIDFTC